MHVIDWWQMQFLEGMKKASQHYEQFKKALQPNVDDLDMAVKIYEDISQAYDLNETNFDEFIDFGKSLRARQAQTYLSRGL